MRKKLLLPSLAVLIATAIGIGVYLGSAGTTPSQASTEPSKAVSGDGDDSDPGVVTSHLRSIVGNASLGESSPLAEGAEDEITPLFTTPEDDSLPSFYTVPTSDGGTCIVTSSGVLASCAKARSVAEGSGTVTAIDDVEGDGVPAVVYGQTNHAVVKVVVNIAGKSYSALVRDGFYVLRFPSASLRVDEIDTVAFTMTDGSVVTRDVAG